MKRLVRGASGAAVALVLAASALTIPTAASAADPLPAPSVLDAQALDNGPGATGGAVQLYFESPEPTFDATKVLVGYEAVIRSGESFATIEQTVTISNPKAHVVIFETLTYGREYKVGVAAKYLIDGTTTEYSAYGYNESGGIFGGGPLVPLRDPLPVVNLSATSKKSGALTAKWSLPAAQANTNAALYFIVTATPTDDFGDLEQYDTSQTSCYGSCTSATLTGLRNGVQYDVSVAGLASPFGFAYNEVYTWATPYGAPSRPSNLTASRSGSNVKLDWNPTKATKAGPVTGYKVYVNGSLKKTLGKTVSLTSVSGIKKGKSYTFAVRSYNAHGFSSLLVLKKKW